MTAETFKFPEKFLESCANEIVNNVKGINRVCYDLTSKPPGTIEWEQSVRKKAINSITYFRIKNFFEKKYHLKSIT